MKLKYLLKYWSIQISNGNIWHQNEILASLSSCGSKPIPKSFFCGTQKKIFWRMFQLLKHWDILQNIFFVFHRKYTVPFNMYKETVHCVCILDLGLTAENCSRRLLFIAVHTNPGLSELCLCVCVSESPPITPLVWAMKCDGSLKKNKAPHLPLSLICTWRAAVLYDNYSHGQTHTHTNTTVFTHLPRMHWERSLVPGATVNN